MNLTEIKIAPEIFIGASTSAVGFSFGFTISEVVDTNSPALNKKFWGTDSSVENITLHSYRNFQSNEKQIGFFNTPIFEPDAKKSASKSISLDTLNNIAKLENGWNGYSAKSIPHEVIFLCRKIIMILDYQPEIYPTARRTIQMEYEKFDKSYLEFEIGREEIKVMEVPKRQYKNAKQYNINSSNYNVLSELVNKFCGGISEWETSTIPEPYIA